MTTTYTNAQLPPLYVALLNARDAYLASAKQFPKPKDRAILRKQALLISNHMAQILAERQAAMQGQGGEAVIPSASSNCPICGVDSPHGHNMKDRWIGVDLDNTLATDGGGRLDPYTIGEPIYPMVHRVMNWVARGYEVRIFTARMCEYSYTSKQHRNVGKMQEAIGDWCLTHIGTRLEATNQKDGAMEVLWDDRAVYVIPNQGIPSFIFEQISHATIQQNAEDAKRLRAMERALDGLFDRREYLGCAVKVYLRRATAEILRKGKPHDQD